MQLNQVVVDVTSIHSFAPTFSSLEDVLLSVGNVRAGRVILDPPPGMATEEDVLRIHARDRWFCELINGVLVSKTINAYESLLAATIACELSRHAQTHDLGVVLGAGGPLRLFPSHVRIPDACFISWDQLPGRVFPRAPIPSMHPDLAVEVLNPDNTKPEMHNKLHDYFNSGARLVWYLDPDTQIMEVYTSTVERTEVGIDGVLDGGVVLPGLHLPMAEIFSVPRAAE